MACPNRQQHIPDRAERVPLVPKAEVEDEDEL